MSDPRVSVVIPTFNRSRLMAEAIRSAQAQTFQSIEILVIDDGSTDDTPAVAAGFGSAIRYIRQQNRGVNAARNAGIAQARGEYVALLDSDDLWEPFKTELQVAVLDCTPDAAFTFSDFHILRQSGEIAAGGLSTWHADPSAWRGALTSRRALPASIHGVLPRGRDVAIHVGDLYALSLPEPYVLPSASLFRRNAWGGGLVFAEFDSTCGDWEFFARLSRAAGAAFVPVETTFNRSHEDEVRLTRISHTVQTTRRVAMIDRVWRADPAFMASHGEAVDRLQRELLLQLGMWHLAESDRIAARGCFERARALGARDLPGLHRIASALTRVPGSGSALQMARHLRRLARF